MKTLKILAAAFAAVFMAASCTKEGAARFEGNYTFKTGGSIEVAPGSGTVPSTDSGTGQEEVATGTQTVLLTSESGQMDILTVDKGAGDMIVTMNIIGGTIVTFDAKADGEILTLEPVSRRISFPVSPSATGGITQPYADVVVEGYGEKFDNVVLFRLSYTGNYIYQNTQYAIVASNVDCVAKKN